MPAVPILETSRLLMRGGLVADFEAYAAMRQQPAFYRYLSREAPSPEDTWNMLLRNIAHWQLLDYGYWAVEEKETGRFVGAIGYADNKRTLTPSLGSTPEIGWLLDPAVHGRGYASEAIAAAIKWGDAQLAEARTVCLIHPENKASLRLAQKFGYETYSQVLYKETPILLLERLRDE
jgi:RimJ/RimL family protein N-acetyltransferase